MTTFIEDTNIVENRLSLNNNSDKIFVRSTIRQAVLLESCHQHKTRGVFSPLTLTCCSTPRTPLIGVFCLCFFYAFHASLVSSILLLFFSNYFYSLLTFTLSPYFFSVSLLFIVLISFSSGGFFTRLTL